VEGVEGSMLFCTSLPFLLQEEGGLLCKWVPMGNALFAFTMVSLSLSLACRFSNCFI
jgi:hypothetical protein